METSCQTVSNKSTDPNEILISNKEKRRIPKKVVYKDLVDKTCLVTRFSLCLGWSSLGGR